MKEYTGQTRLNLRINDEVRTVWVSPADTLLSTLRNGLGLTGSKAGCENGDCGRVPFMPTEFPSSRATPLP
jgi:carbon-monoxide dehydrogenase small subunit